MQKTLSVCIVLFNRWKLSKECIESIARTVPANWEIEWCLIDNGSTDETQKELESLVATLRGKVGFLQMLKTTIKATEAVNRPMNASMGEYMLRTDNDILFTQGWFEDCLAIIDNPKFIDVGFVCPTHHVRQSNKGYRPFLVEGNLRNGKKVVIDMVSEKNMNVPGNIFGRTMTIKDIGGFYTPYNLLHADVHYCMVAKHMGYKFGYTWSTQCPHVGSHDLKEDYSQKAVHERRSEDERYKAIGKGDFKDKHPQEIEFAQQLSQMIKERGKKLPFHKKINVLIPSSGRRVELVEAFKEIFSIPRWEGKVYTCGCDEHMPTAYISDGHIIVPSIHDEDYIKVIMQVCKDYSIRYIFPVIDHDVKVLSEAKTTILRTTGTEVITPDYENAKRCFDKLETAKLFKDLNIPHPETFAPGEAVDGNSVKIYKPRYGFASKGIYERDYSDTVPENYIAQEKIIGTEYTVDCVSDRRFDIISLVARERVAVRGGETQHGKVVNHLHNFQYLAKISTRLELIGPWCAQYIIDAQGKLWFIEINTRFGGGAPISIRAGQHQPLIALKALERDFFGYHYRYLVEWGLESLRFDRAIYRHIETRMTDHDADGKKRLQG